MPIILLALKVETPSFNVFDMSFCLSLSGTWGFYFFGKPFLFVETTIFLEEAD